MFTSHQFYGMNFREEILYFYYRSIRSLGIQLKRILPPIPYICGPRERLKIGKTVSLCNAILNTNGGTITLSDYVMLAHNVMILTGMHDISVKGDKARRPSLANANNNIVIKEGAFISSGVIILGGVTIGKNSVVGAGSVVVRDIPDNVLAVGNPARPVRTLYDESDQM